jgi:hypothetical protein
MRLTPAARFKLLIKAVWIGSMVIALTACATTIPTARIGQVQPVQVKDKTYYHYPVAIQGVGGTDAVILFTHDEEGNYKGSVLLPPNSILGSMVPAGLGAISPVGTMLGTFLK